MKNMGFLRYDWNPVVPGGLSEHQIKHLESLGWLHGTSDHDVDEAPVGFMDAVLPGQFTMHNVSIRSGTKFMYDPDTERAVILECGNPSCWRYLMR